MNWRTLQLATSDFPRLTVCLNRRPNQSMELTATRTVFTFHMTKTSSLERRSLSVAVVHLILVKCNDTGSEILALEATILAFAFRHRSGTRVVDTAGNHICSWSSSSRIHSGISRSIRCFLHRTRSAVVFVRRRMASSSFQMTRASNPSMQLPPSRTAFTFHHD